MQKLYEIFKALKVQERIVSTETNRGNTGDAFCQSSFRWIYYYGSNKSAGKETGKSHLCALVRPVRFSSKKQASSLDLQWNGKICFLKK